MKLSIIIPFYNTPTYTAELLEMLDGQITQDVEVILVDDGSKMKKWAMERAEQYQWLWVVMSKHGGPSKARNIGISKSTGEYIQFIDSDDMVPSYFVERVLERIPEGSDLIEYSWRSLGDNRFNYRLSPGGRLPNVSVCTRCFKRSFIGNMRFNEQKDATEDEDFMRRLGVFRDPVKISTISDYMYYYRKMSDGTESRFRKGETKTKRIVYFFREVTRDRKDIFSELKAASETDQVVLMTYANGFPELERYCQVIRPCNTWAHIQRGEPYSRVILVPEKEAEGERLSEKKD